MTTQVKEKNSETLGGKVKPSQKEYVDHAITGPNGEKLEFNEKIALLIKAYKEQVEKSQENKIQIGKQLERVKQYNEQIAEIMKAIARDSEQLVELNNEEIGGRIEELKKSIKL